MKKVFAWVVLLIWTPLALAVAPYITGDKVNGGDVKSVMSQVEKKLTAEGFSVIGRLNPSGMQQYYGVVVVTDKGIQDAITSIGGSAVIGSAIRVGVRSDGSVSYMNPDYWYRAYFRKQFSAGEHAVKAVSEKLKNALGAGKTFGGDITPDKLPNYNYMVGMEKFDSDKNELKSYSSFETAVKTVQDNLAKGTNNTAKVYEVIIPGKRIAVFGVAMNDPKMGDGAIAKKIGPDNIAAFPYEIYIVNGKVNALYGRYRLAIGWPNLGMGTFMGVSDAPDAILEALTGVAGGIYEKSSSF